jgi:hypothetical protein
MAALRFTTLILIHAPHAGVRQRHRADVWYILAVNYGANRASICAKGISKEPVIVDTLEGTAWGGLQRREGSLPGTATCARVQGFAVNC